MLFHSMSLGCSLAHLRAVIAVFRDVELDRPLSLSLEDFRSPAIMFSRHSWEAIKDNFTVEETIVLAKALTRFEERFEWPRSCEAAAIFILKDLWDREPKTAELLAGWIARRTKNGYLRLACDHQPKNRLLVGDFDKSDGPAVSHTALPVAEMAGLGYHSVHIHSGK